VRAPPTCTSRRSNRRWNWLPTWSGHRLNRPEIAATFYGARRRITDIGRATHLPEVIAHLRAALGDTSFNEHVEAARAMSVGDAGSYAQRQRQRADE
jgi:hypothetical protein